MSKERQKMQKKKLREKEVRKKVLEQREELRKERKLMKAEEKKERDLYILEHGKLPPALPGNPALAAIAEAQRSQKAADKIAKNLELLKKLQEEFEQEQSTRERLNQNLENEGHISLKEKMEALAEKTSKIKEAAERIAADDRKYAEQHNSVVK